MGTMTTRDQLELYRSDSDVSLEKPSEPKVPLFTESELEYFIKVLKNPATVEASTIDIASVHSRAHESLKTVMHEILLEEAFKTIDKQYISLLAKNLGKNTQENHVLASETLLKLLLRYQKMTTIHGLIEKIMKRLVLFKVNNKNLRQSIVDYSVPAQTLQQRYAELVRLGSTIASEISTVQATD